MEHLQAFIGDCDKRTELAKQRLLETQEELSAEVSVKANHVHQLAEEIGKKLARAEQLGEEGFVEESLKLMGEVSCHIECLFSPMLTSRTLIHCVKGQASSVKRQKQLFLYNCLKSLI